jgi:hypothetical protein
MMSPISTIKTYLIKETDAGGGNMVYSLADGKLGDIKTFPNIGGAAEMIESTTLSNQKQTFIKGVQSQDVLEFAMNYDATVFATLAGLSAETNYELWFGEYGQYGKFQITGESDVWINAGGVNNVVEMMFDIFPTDESSKIARVVDIAGTYGVSYVIVAGEPVMDFSSATKQTGTNSFYVNVLRSYKPHLNDWDSAFAEASGWYTVDVDDYINLDGLVSAGDQILVAEVNTSNKIVRGALYTIPAEA